MMTEQSKEFLNTYAKNVRQNVSDYSEILTSNFYKDAMTLILDIQSKGGRVHVTELANLHMLQVMQPLYCRRQERQRIFFMAQKRYMVHVVSL